MPPWLPLHPSSCSRQQPPTRACCRRHPPPSCSCQQGREPNVPPLKVEEIVVACQRGGYNACVDLAVQATRAGLDAQAVQRLPPAVAKKLIKGGCRPARCRRWMRAAAAECGLPDPCRGWYSAPLPPRALPLSPGLPAALTAPPRPAGCPLLRRPAAIGCAQGQAALVPAPAAGGQDRGVLGGNVVGW